MFVVQTLNYVSITGGILSTKVVVVGLQFDVCLSSKIINIKFYGFVILNLYLYV